MTNLEDFLGSIFSSISHARRMADEESAAIAEYYKDNPALENMTVPRIRIPEFTLDIPILIEENQDKQAPKMRETAKIVNDLIADIRNTAKNEAVTLPATFLTRYRRQMLGNIDRFKKNKKTKLLASREMMVRSAEKTLVDMLKRDQLKLPADKVKQIQHNLRLTTRDAVFEDYGHASKLQVNTLTTDVKDKASPNNIARIKLTLREEGLEWQSVENQDGTLNSYLGPE